jgi:peptidoglycan/xylan/chitin deacetylase (PgdA/CDA1 family)
MIRNWIKAGAAGVLARTGMDRFAASLSGSGDIPVVIGYHRVVEDFASSSQTSIPSLLVSRQMLERHLDWIGRRFRFVSLDEVGSRLESGSGFGGPIAAITFDDGYRDFYDLAFPLLQKKGIPAAVFVVTDLVSTNRAHLHDKLYVLLAQRLGCRIPSNWNRISLPDVASLTPYQAARVLIEALPLAAVEHVVSVLEEDASIPEGMSNSFRLLTWEMLESIQRAGMIVGSHTKTHTLLPNESEVRVKEEVTGSRQEIEKRLGIEVKHFTYPSGLFTTTSVSAVAAAGYRFGYTGCTHRDPWHPLLTIPRTILWENSSLDGRRSFSGSVLGCQIRHAFDWVNGCRQQHTAFGDN